MNSGPKHSHPHQQLLGIHRNGAPIPARTAPVTKKGPPKAESVKGQPAFSLPFWLFQHLRASSSSLFTTHSGSPSSHSLFTYTLTATAASPLSGTPHCSSHRAHSQAVGPFLFRPPFTPDLRLPHSQPCLPGTGSGSLFVLFICFWFGFVLD